MDEVAPQQVGASFCPLDESGDSELHLSLLFREVLCPRQLFPALQPERLERAELDGGLHAGESHYKNRIPDWQYGSAAILFQWPLELLQPTPQGSKTPLT